MARDFDDASSEYITTANGLLSAYPMSFAAWFYTDQAAIEMRVLSLGNTSTDNNNCCLTMSGGKARFFMRDPSSSNNAETSASYSTNIWQHMAGRGVSATERHIYLNGGNKATHNTSVLFPTLTHTHIGARARTSIENYFSGRIADCAVWNVTISEDEVAMLAKGFSARFIRPQNIVSYWRLIHNDNDIVGGFNMSVGGGTPTFADHAPIIQTAGPHIITAPSAAAPGAPSRVPTQMIGPIITKLILSNPVGVAFAGGLLGLHKIIKRRQKLMK